MAAYNEITLPDWQNRVRRIFGLQGPGGNVPVLAPEIQPVAIVDPFSPEHEVITGRLPFAVGSTFDWKNDAVLRGGLEFRNPTGSNVLVVVTYILAKAHLLYAGSAVEAVWTLGLVEPGQPALTTLVRAPTTRDTRRGTSTGVVHGLELRSQNNFVTVGEPLAQGVFYAPMNVFTTVTFEPRWAVTMLPGWALRWSAPLVAAAATIKAVELHIGGYLRNLLTEEATG